MIAAFAVLLIPIWLGSAFPDSSGGQCLSLAPPTLPDPHGASEESGTGGWTVVPSVAKYKANTAITLTISNPDPDAAFYGLLFYGTAQNNRYGVFSPPTDERFGTTECFTLTTATIEHQDVGPFDEGVFQWTSPKSVGPVEFTAVVLESLSTFYRITAKVDGPSGDAVPSVGGGTPAAGAGGGGGNVFKAPNGKVEMTWTIDGDVLSVTMKAQTTGWVSFGPASSKFMKDKADYWTGWVGPDGRAVVYDTKSNSYSTPTLDASQDLRSVTGSVANGVTTISFIRDLVTGDADDIPITAADLPIQWAYSTTPASADWSGDNYPVHPGSAGGGAGSGTVNFVSGASSAATLGFEINPGNLLTILASLAMFVYAAARYAYAFSKWYRLRKGTALGVGKSASMLGNSAVPSPRARGQSMAPKAADGNSAAAARWRAQWQEMFADDGYPYYYNGATGETVWEIPPMPDYFDTKTAAQYGLNKPQTPMSPLSSIAVEGNHNRPVHVNVEAKSTSGGCWAKLKGALNARIPRTHKSWASIISAVLYLAFNIILLVLVGGEEQTIENKWGSLAIANALLVAIPATRNSVLVWGLGLPFDRVIVYHRWLGRWMFLTATFHMFWYYAMWVKQNLNTTKMQFNDATGLNKWGFWSWFCCLFLIITSFGYFRRRHFEFFFYSHFSFVLIYLFAYWHNEACKPYVLAALVFYALDRVIRGFWGLLPMKTTLIQVKRGDIVQVRFPKHPLARKMQLYKVGQYVFLNFPQLSLMEWHPFSISSGPNETTGEVHIRGLGNHTNQLMERTKAGGNTPLWIRVDGPYGTHNLNYRRYPVIMLVGGGIGITPAVSILKDIYRVGDYPGAPNRQTMRAGAPPHCVEGIYCVWVIPEEKAYDWFANEFEECFRASEEDGMPVLNLWVYVTRQQTVTRTDVCVPGKPDFDAIFATSSEQFPNKAMHAFACGPEMMTSATWDACFAQNKKGRRVDFHHETFEF